MAGGVPCWGGTLPGYPWQGTPGTPQAGYPPAGYPPGQGTPRQGIPPAGYPPGWTCQGTLRPDMARGVPCWGGTLPGYPWQGTPRYPPGRVLPSRVPPWAGYPPGRVSPQQGTPLAGPGRVPPPAGPGRVPPRCLSHGILGNVAKHYGIWVPPPPVDRQMDGQTRVKTLPSRRTTYAGGNYDLGISCFVVLV